MGTVTNFLHNLFYQCSHIGKILSSQMKTKLLICVYLSIFIKQLEAGTTTKGYNTQVTDNHRDDVKPRLSEMKKILKKNQKAVGPTAEALMGSAKEIAEVLKDVKDVILKDLDESIKSIKVDIEGVEQQQKNNMRYALTKVYIAEGDIQYTKIQLQQLAKTNIRGVDRMIKHMSWVKDDWELWKIEKFLLLEVKIMSQLVTRSLDLLDRADKLYSRTKISLADVRAKMESFNSHILNLSDSRSKAYKDRVQALRMKVYIPCCVFVWTCPACALGLELAINSWKNELNGLKTTIAKNSNIITSLVTNVKDNLEFIKKEEKLIAGWGEALEEMKSADWKFEMAEIVGFKEAKIDVVNSLEFLKKAAENYLKRKD